MATYEEWQADLQRQIAADREAELQRRAEEERAWLEEQRQNMLTMQQQGGQVIPLSNLVNDYGSQNEARRLSNYPTPQMMTPSYENEARRLSNYGGPEQSYLPQSPQPVDLYADRNAKLNDLLKGSQTTGEWTRGESGRPMLTMVGKGDGGFQSLGKYATPQEFINAAPDIFAKVNPDLVGKYKQQTPQEIALADMSRQAIDVLRDPNATIAQKQAAFKLVQPSGTSLDEKLKQAQIENYNRQNQPKPEWGTIESGGKVYQINKNTGEIRPAVVDGEQLAGKPAKVGKGALTPEQMQQQQQGMIDNAGRIIDFIDSATSHLQKYPGSNTLSGQVTQNLWGSNAKALGGYLESIKGNIGFEQLKKMKVESPTGASGLGQIAVAELKALQSVLGNLEQGNPNLGENLQLVRNHYQKFIDASNKLTQQGTPLKFYSEDEEGNKVSTPTTVSSGMTGQIERSTSKSGRPIFKRPGSNQWEYE